MKILMFIMLNGFLFSISPSSVHTNKSSNQSAVIQETSPQQKDIAQPLEEILEKEDKRLKNAHYQDQQPDSSDC